MRVPDGWFDYSRFGSPIDSTRIVAIKTPLKKQFNTGKLARLSGDYTKIMRGVPIEEEFTPQQMLQMFKERGWNVGLVIDLTYTDRYYDPQDFTCRGVKHLKVKCPGQIIPPDDIYQQLRDGISDFLSDPSNGRALVAVHCTHGLNRTGYLICRYLIEECGYNVERAIQAFNKGRGSDIERENYLEHLRKGCPRDDSPFHSPKRPKLPAEREEHKSRSVNSDRRHNDVFYGGMSDTTPLRSDYCTTTSRGEGSRRRHRIGTGSSGQVWDLRMQLDHKAASRMGDSADQRGRSGRRERRENRRAHYMERPYQVETHHRDYSHYQSWEPPLPVQYLYHDERVTPGYHTPAGTTMWTGQMHHVHADYSQSRHNERDVRRSERLRRTRESQPVRW